MIRSRYFKFIQTLINQQYAEYGAMGESKRENNRRRRKRGVEWRRDGGKKNRDEPSRL